MDTHKHEPLRSIDINTELCYYQLDKMEVAEGKYTMNYKMTMKNGDILLELSKDEIDTYISNRTLYGTVQFMDYLYDETGNMCGIKAAADLGHGYGFSNGFEVFAIKFGETYSFVHEFTSIEGPTDWIDDSFEVVLKLIKLED